MVTRKLLLDRVQDVPPVSTTYPSMPNLISSIPNPISQALKGDFQLGTRLSISLGEEVLRYEPPELSTLKDLASSHANIYLIYMGRVRLLYHNPVLQRNVSASMLESAALFGGDHLFHQSPLPYRAVAAEPCQVIQLPYEDVACLYETYPSFRSYLHQKVQERERLIFFRGFTSLRSHPSKTLQYQLLPYLSEQHIAAGTPLAPGCGDRSGYVWLRSGQISNPVDPSVVPSIGDGWQEGTSAAKDWVAETDLILYKMLGFEG